MSEEIKSKNLKITTIKSIELNDWNHFVEETYKRPYNLQQQDGCMPRGIVSIQVPYDGEFDYENESIPEIVNYEQKGVSFAAWLARDPNQKLSEDNETNGHPALEKAFLNLWWHRNFYPDISMIVNDLHSKGLLEAGEYKIIIDW